MSEQAKQTPLVELLDAVPEDVRIGVQDSEDWNAGTTWHPVGRLCRDAAAELRRLHAELHMNKRANEVWEEKTAWVQDTALPRESGMHRADVLKDRIDRLKRTKAELLEVLRRIATVNAMDYEYQAWARAAVAKVEGA